MKRGGLTAEEIQNLWDRVFLSIDQIQDLLEQFQLQLLQPFVYPLFRFAAHTGGRRSETDIDFAGKKILLRDKKRGTGLRTHRHVSLCPFLAQVMNAWIAKQRRPETNGEAH